MIKKVLVIGSEGATGRSISETLQKEENLEVFRLGRKKSHQIQKQENFFQGNLDDIQFCRSIAKDYQFDFIVYVAGIWRGKNTDQADYNDNLIPFKNFISSIARNARHIVFFSSSAIYNPDNEFKESRISLNTYPTSTYGKAKLDSENILIDFCINNGINFTILRPFHIVSQYEHYCRGRSHVVTDFIYEAMNDINSFKKKLNSFPDIWIPFTWSHDVARLILSLAKKRNLDDEIYNVGSSESYSLNQLHDCIYRNLYNQDGKIVEYKSKKITTFDKSIKKFGNYSETQINDFVKAFIDYKSKNINY